ncbi:hypothetical protein B0O99DRAFT_599445 [Bisporella sp. PMI_857]|nr:hypothetical protein B0O99DRAFT_599445 [Bisporella sp. PMI_857]
MADDSMEISSDHDYNVGDEDIDIDIDLTGDIVDEDHILEDVGSNIGFGDDIEEQHLASTSYDDVMLDDDGDDRSTQMEDAETTQLDNIDIIQEVRNHPMDDEGLSMPLATTDDFSVHLEDSSKAAPSLSNLEEIAQPISEAEQSDPRASNQVEFKDLPENINEVQLERQESNNLKTKEESPCRTPNEKSETESHRADIAIEKSQPESPGHNPSDVENNSEPSSVTSKSPILGPTDTARAYDGQLDHANHSDKDANAEAPDSTTDLKPPPYSESLEVKVIYQDLEYDLFSSSDSDDPDSFFLSELSFAKQPLTDLFAAIRLVIQDDIAQDGLLSIAIEDLGLEFQEESTLTKDITIDKLVRLHKSLQENDGVETLQPLFINLDKKVNSELKFARLTTNAEEGRGLSELHAWDEYSQDDGNELSETDILEEQKSTAEKDQDKPDHEEFQPKNPHQAKFDQHFAHDGQIAPIERELRNLNQEELDHEAYQQTEKVNETEAAEDSDFNQISEAQGSHLTQSPVPNIGESPAVPSDEPASGFPETVLDNPKGEDLQVSKPIESSTTIDDSPNRDDENDLIDYSDEDDEEHIVKNQSDQGDSTLAPKSEDNTTGDGTADDRDEAGGGESATPRSTGGNEIVELDERYQEDPNLGDNIAEYEESAFDDDDLYQQDEAGLAEDGAFQHGGHYDLDSSLNQYGPDSEGSNLNAKELGENGSEDDFDLGEDADHEGTHSGLDLEHLGNDDSQAAVPIHSLAEESFNSNFPPSDRADAESAESDNTLVAQAGTEFDEHEDEIDYDEDDGGTAAIHEAASLATSDVLIAGSNKRARSDASLDDSSRNKEAKRPKS